VPHVVPNVLGPDAGGAAGWADASVVVPWDLYQASGNERILETQYESMKEWVEYMRADAARDSTRYLRESETFGDWVAFTSGPDRARFYPGAYTNTDLISTAYFARSTDLLRRTAEILGKPDDAERYADLFQQIKAAFQEEYVTPNGRVISDTQTSYLLALQFNLLPEGMTKETARTLTGEPITPDDQAEAIFLLVSDDRFGKTTGQIVSVDGGLQEAFLR
jgi:alpha-L-rhamnosidase